METEWYTGNDTLDPEERQRIREEEMQISKVRVDEYGIDPGDDAEIEAQLDCLIPERETFRNQLANLEQEIFEEEQKFIHLGLKQLLTKRDELITEHDHVSAEIFAWRVKGKEIGATLKRRY